MFGHRTPVNRPNRNRRVEESNQKRMSGEISGRSSLEHESAQTTNIGRAEKCKMDILRNLDLARNLKAEVKIAVTGGVQDFYRLFEKQERQIKHHCKKYNFPPPENVGNSEEDVIDKDELIIELQRKISESTDVIEEYKEYKEEYKELEANSECWQREIKNQSDLILKIEKERKTLIKEKDDEIAELNQRIRDLNKLAEKTLEACARERLQEENQEKISELKRKLEENNETVQNQRKQIGKLEDRIGKLLIEIKN